MARKELPIQRKLMRAILITSGSVMILTCAIYFVYEVYSFRQSSVKQLTILGKIIAANSTAAIAFDSPEEAFEILSSLKAEPHIVATCLYDNNGELFTSYPADFPENSLPKVVEQESYRFEDAHLIGFQPIEMGNNHLGTLYIKSDISAMYERFKLFGIIALLAIILSIALAYMLSARMQKGITKPILALTGAARAFSEQRDFNVRAVKYNNDEVGLLTDAFNHMLTEIQTQNHEIQSFNYKLEQKISERTSQLEAVNKELESFSYSVSHDLRAPLRSIHGYASILIRKYEDKVDEKGKHYLDVISNSAIKMGQLIDDLLAFSRVGKQNIEKVTLNMKNLTTVVVDEMKSQYTKKVEIKLAEMHKINGDSSMIRQVMANLVSNALKYSMKKDLPVIEIGSYVENNMIVYYVKDNGAGFDMLYYDKLFGVFQRLHSDSEFEGIGVGLALVHRIITKHDGEVWAEGRVDEGATFYFSIPDSNSRNDK